MLQHLVQNSRERETSDRLLDTVVDVASDMRDEGTKATDRSSVLLTVGSLFIARFNAIISFGESARTDP